MKKLSILLVFITIFTFITSSCGAEKQIEVEDTTSETRLVYSVPEKEKPDVKTEPSTSEPEIETKLTLKSLMSKSVSLYEWIGENSPEKLESFVLWQHVLRTKADYVLEEAYLRRYPPVKIADEKDFIAQFFLEYAYYTDEKELAKMAENTQILYSQNETNDIYFVSSQNGVNHNSIWVTLENLEIPVDGLYLLYENNGVLVPMEKYLVYTSDPINPTTGQVTSFDDAEPLPYSPEEIEGFRQMIPLVEPTRNAAGDVKGTMDDLGFPMDETALKISSLITNYIYLNFPIEFSKPSEASDGFLIMAAIHHVPYKEYSRDYYEGLFGYPDKTVFKMSAHEIAATKEQVEYSIEKLFGEKIAVDHGNFVSAWKYESDFGVYLSPGTGFYFTDVVFVLDYTEEGSVIEATIANASYGTQEVWQVKSEGEYISEIPKEDIVDYVKNKSEQYNVTLHKQADGRWTLYSFELKVSS